MSEELLKTIIQLFSIVAKERITDEERANIKEFLSFHLKQESVDHYLQLFENYVKEYRPRKAKDLENLDDDTLEFLDEWSNIIKITKEVNKALTISQKLVMVIKIIELVYSDDIISERQANLIFYIGESLKIEKKTMTLVEKFVIGSDYEELDNKNILLIDEGSGDEEEQIKGPRMVRKNLTGLIAVLRIPGIETYFVKYLGISTLYLNGISMRSRKIDFFPTGSTIRGNKISAIYYSDVINRFLTSEERTKITFSAEHLFYHFKSGKAGLQNIHLSEEGGKLIGIMGASGSGKSTLLSVLNGVEPPSSGRVLINGINIHDNPENVEGLLGYVPQDDFLIGELTVFDNLYFAAKLAFRNNTPLENTALVDKLLTSLGISETRNLKVGSPDDKTISGGQRKRINIGLELLREPSILFVDEPTSGLSSRDSENIMDLLKELSFRGKMVFVVIHQPSSDIFKMFDKLVILDTGGYQIYYGNPVDSVTYFREIINAANKLQGACPECGNINPEQVFNIIETRLVNEFGRSTETRKVSPTQWYQYFRENIKLEKVEQSQDELQISQNIPGRLSQMVTFFTRDVKSKLANKQYLTINLLEAPVLALFMAFMVRYYTTIDVDKPFYSFYENDNIPIYFFMSIIVALFMGLTVSAEEIFRDRMILKRERFLNLSKFSYLSSKVFVLFLISAIQTGTFVVIGDLILEIKGNEPRFWFILFSSSCFANILGLNISASFRSAVTIYILIPLLIIPQLLLSGVVINFDKFNPVVSKLDGVPIIGELMASRWGFEAAVVSQFKDNPFEKKFFEVDREIANAKYKRMYYLPRLESELDWCFNNLDNKYGDESENFEENLEIICTELSKELKQMGRKDFEGKENMDLRGFDSLTYYSVDKTLSTLKTVYSSRLDAALEKKDEIITSMGDGYDSLSKVYRNEEIINTVKNYMNLNRVIELDGELVRKVDPIFITDHEPEGIFDFRAPFYSSVKHFAGIKWNTFYFNLAVIWTMSVFLFITLYFDILKKAVNIFSKSKKRKRRNFI